MNGNVDLVMTAYNSAGFIERALDSVLRQTVRPHVIIVDDASTDGTAERVEFYAERTGLDVELLRLPENLGAGIAKRVGIQRSKAEFVTFLDSDDILPRRSLEWFLERQKEGNYDIVAGGVVKCIDGEVSLFSGNPPVVMTGKEAVIPFIERNLCNLFANSKLVRKSVLEKCPPYSELRFGEDTDSVYRWFSESESVYIDTSFPAYLYVVRGGSITKSDFSMNKFECVVRTLDNLITFCEHEGIPLSKLVNMYISVTWFDFEKYKSSPLYDRMRIIERKIGVKRSNE